MYTEVHHIEPLAERGEDAIENLPVYGAEQSETGPADHRAVARCCYPADYPEITSRPISHPKQWLSC